MTDVAGTPGVRFAKHQRIADLGNVLAFPQQLEIPAAIDGVAVQACADELVAAQHELFIHPADRVRQHDFISVFAALEFTGGKQIDAGDFQFR